MDELGHILREARENKGLTLEEAQDATRINARYLEALETGQYGELPTAVHVRGFLRNYARFLGLDPEPLLDRYQYSQGYQAPPVASHSESPINSDAPLPSRNDQPFFDPVNVEVDVGSRRDPESAVRLIIIAALIIAVALIANRFVPLLLNNEDGSTAITTAVTDAVQNVLDRTPDEEVPAAGEGNVDTADINATLTAEEVITSTTRNNFDTVLPTPVSTRPALPATMDEIALQIDVTERTWMEVTIDGDVVFSGIARTGDTFEWTATEEAKVLTGNAAGVVVTINEIELGRLGERGENREEVWQTTGS